MRRQRSWTAKDEERLRKLYARTSLAELASIFRRSACAVKSRAGVLGLTRGNRNPWTAKEDKILKRLNPDTPGKKIAQRLGRPLTQVYQRARRLGLEKSAEYIARQNSRLGKALNKSGAAHRFPPGHVPANKGLRRPGWAPGRMSETQFKKGERSGAAQAKWVPVGTVKMNGDGYLRRKIADEPEEIAGKGAHSTNWEFVHRRVWEDANGPIPKGYRIWWKDGNHWNCALENLELVSGLDHMMRTSIHTLPHPLKEVIQLKGSIKRQITMKTRKKEMEASA